MCRNIRTLHNFDPPTTPEEVHAAALQYVRKVAGSTRPSRANAAAFEKAVADVARATEKLLGALVPGAPPRSREEEAVRARERWQRRAARMGA
jgi:hypothetical protein